MADLPKSDLAGWGNHPLIQAQCLRFYGEGSMAQLPEGSYIPRGLGRGYGDCALAERVLDMTGFNRFLAFDPVSGLLSCEAGVTLEEILQSFVPRGWFLPVTPGTKFVTVGGAIAADVHGKNHHVEGCFGDHVHWMDLMLPSGEVKRISPQSDAQLFGATRGGMGLTGVILRAAVALKPIETAWIRQETRRFGCLEAIMDGFEASAGHTYSVAWIDGLASGKKLGRSVLFRGEHALKQDLPDQRHPLILRDKRKLAIPIFLPSFTLNPLTVRAFNMSYYGVAPSRWKQALVDYDSFFYPLDHILTWNRLYGRKGFTQYQFVLPLESSRAGLRLILDRIARSGEGSFLSVLKLFGKQDGVLSFPREGYTLALDFPIKSTTFALLDELDRMVLDHGGRIYLAKDVRMSGATFRAGYEHVNTFLDHKHALDPTARLRSLQSDRLGVDP